MEGGGRWWREEGVGPRPAGGAFILMARRGAVVGLGWSSETRLVFLLRGGSGGHGELLDLSMPIKRFWWRSASIFWTH